jgi:hypothetical protein
MTEFKKYLTEELISVLDKLADPKSATNWWKDVLANRELLLAVRGGYLNAYAKGQSIFKIGPLISDGRPIVETHYKYLVTPELEEGNPYVKFDGATFEIDPAHAIQQKYNNYLTLERLIKTATHYAGAEKAGVHRIAAKEPKVIDVEIAFSSETEPTERSSAPRVDVAVLVPDDEEHARLVFCEAKLADNDDLHKCVETKECEEPRVAVVTQIEKYEKFISEPKNVDILAKAYVDVCKILVAFHKQSWHKELDPLIRGVAEGKIKLTINPYVYLLVYGFDADNRRGIVKRRLERLRRLLGHRVIGKGNPSSFMLSKDILVCEDRIRKNRCRAGVHLQQVNSSTLLSSQ